MVATSAPLQAAAAPPQSAAAPPTAPQQHYHQQHLHHQQHHQHPQYPNLNGQVAGFSTPAQTYLPQVQPATGLEALLGGSLVTSLALVAQQQQVAALLTSTALNSVLQAQVLGGNPALAALGAGAGLFQNPLASLAAGAATAQGLPTQLTTPTTTAAPPPPPAAAAAPWPSQPPAAEAQVTQGMPPLPDDADDQLVDLLIRWYQSGYLTGHHAARQGR